jgi:acyl-CoA synthetase (AMP-forming)/AMP-acid ligase II
MTIWEAASGLTFLDAVRQRAHADPDRPFCKFDDKPWHSYGDLWANSSRYCSALTGLGLQPGDRVIVFMSKRVEYLLAMTGIQAAGAVYVPVNAEYSPADLAVLVGDCEPRFILTDATLAGAAVAAVGLVPGCNAVILSVDASPEQGDVRPLLGLLTVADADVTSRAQTDELAIIMYTSGTTGRPKGVAFSHGNLMFLSLVKSVDRSGPGDRGLDFFPLHHFNGGLAQIIPPMFHGSSVFLQQDFHPENFARQLRDNAVTTAAVNSNHVQALLAQPPGDDDADHDCRRMTLGLKIPAADFVEFERRFGTRLLGAYGLTEAVGAFILGSMDYRTPPLSSGRPAPGYELAILDEAGNRLGPGEPGEIAVRAQARYAFFAGYWNDQEKTDALLRDGWLHTGDLGILAADGAFTYLQRAVDQVRRSGGLIAPCIAEDVIIEHPDVLEAVVVGLADDPDNETLVAYVVLRLPAVAPDAADADKQVAEITALCAGQLEPRLVPDHVVRLEQLPKDVLGKINKKRLRQDAGLHLGPAAR